MTEASAPTGYLPLEDLVRDYEPAWGQNWPNFFKDQDTPTDELIDRLADELRQRGSFDEPVTLCAESTDYDEETGETEVYPASVGNGMHRIAAHHRTGIGPVFVQYGWPPFDEEAYEKDFSLKLEFRPYAEWGSDQEMEDFDAIHELLSWRHKGPGYECWMRMGGGGGQDHCWDAYFEQPDTRREDLDLEVLLEDITSRIGDLATVVSLQWESNYWPEDDEADEDEEEDGE